MRTDPTVLPTRTPNEKSVVSSPSPLSLLAFGNRVAKRTANCGTAGVLREHTDLGRYHEVDHVMRALGVRWHAEGQWRVRSTVDVEPGVAGVELEFTNRAEAEADANRHLQAIAAQARERRSARRARFRCRPRREIGRCQSSRDPPSSADVAAPRRAKALSPRASKTIAADDRAMTRDIKTVCGCRAGLSPGRR